MSLVECLKNEEKEIKYEDLKIPNRICFFLHGVLSKEECNNIIEKTEPYFEESISRYPIDYRNNLRQVKDDYLFSKEMFKRIVDYLPKSVNWNKTEISQDPNQEYVIDSLNERFRICKYEKNQYFKIHQDGEYWKNENLQSKLTFMIYLNDQFKGGDTNFFENNEIILKVHPKMGSLIIFEHSLWHEGQILKEGKKYILRSDILYKRVLNSEFKSNMNIELFNYPKDYRKLKKLYEIQGHYGYIWSLLQLKNGNLVSSSRDKFIKIWDIKNGKCLKTLKGHSNSILCLIESKQGYLISGSRDFSIKIWKDDICIQTLLGHEGNVLSLLEISNNLISSSSSDNNIIIWKDFKLFKILKGHKDWIWCLQKHNDLLISGSQDKSIKIWNKDYECIQTLIGHLGPIHSIISLNNQIISSSQDKSIKIWELKDDKFIQILSWNAHNDCINCLLKIDNNIVISGSEDNTIKIWNISKDITLLNSLNLNHFVKSLSLLHSGDIASGSYDSNIKIWSFENIIQ